MPFGIKTKGLKAKAAAAASSAATAVSTGVSKASEAVRDEDARERLALRAREAAGNAVDATKALGEHAGRAVSSDKGVKHGDGSEAVAPFDGGGFAAVEGVSGKKVGEHLQAWGFRPRRPVALFNSLSGCQVEVVKSESVPSWEGGVLWVEPTRLGGAAACNVARKANFPTRAGRRDKEWRERLQTEVMDLDGDGEIDHDEIVEFLESISELRDDPIVQAALEKDRKGETPETTEALLKDLEPVRPKLMAALVGERDYHEAAALQTDEHRTGSLQWTRHMQLKDGWKDPEGIVVRPRAGLKAMEVLVASDPSGLAAKLGAGLMIGVTSQLKAVGFEEGKNLLACGYDWRAPCTRLEERDGHFSKVMHDIEGLVERNDGEAAVVVTHSLGGVCAHYFFQWVAHSDKGRARGGTDWLDRHVHSFVPIGGPMLGTPFGSHSFLTGNEGQGIAPLLIPYADRHLLIRSWGMFGMLFPCGRHLHLQPSASSHWVRREGVLRVHVLAVKAPDGFKRPAAKGGKGGKGDDHDDAPGDAPGAYKHRVHLSLRPPGLDATTFKLQTTPRSMKTDAAFDEQFQFAWASTPDSIEGGALTVSLTRMRREGVRTALSGVVDNAVASGTFQLGCAGGLLETNDEDGKGPCQDLKPNVWSDHALTLEGGVVATVRLCFEPHALGKGSSLAGDFTRAAAGGLGLGDQGAWRCGGPANSGTSEEKRTRLLETLGEKEGTEWRPVKTQARMTARDAEKHGHATYDPARVDQVMVLDGMKHEYECWQGSYADDPIWRRYSTEAPPVKRVWPLYGINVPTLVGSVFRHQTKRYARDEAATGLKLDKHCVVEHPGYELKKGVVKEVPHKTPQADDPTMPPADMTYNTRASGDGTVAYWSLRWPVAWREAGGGIDVEDPLEVEGAGHRDILDKPACIVAVLSECCSHPVKYVEIVLGGISAPQHPSNKQIVLEMMWRGILLSTEAERTNHWSKAVDEVRQFKKQRFVLGVTQQDINENQSLVIRPFKSLDDILKGGSPTTVPVGELLLGSKSPRVFNFGENGEVSLTWNLNCCQADKHGLPTATAARQ